jgi:uncharacterized protein (TIGR03067 family)
VRAILPVFLVAGLLSPGEPGPKEADAAELPKLEGTWNVVAQEFGGKRVGPGAGLADRLVFKGRQVSFIQKPRQKVAEKWICQIDASKKPRRLDLSRLEQDERITIHAIYELKGDELKICLPLGLPKGTGPLKTLGPDEWPAAFDTRGKALLLLSAHRQPSR